MNDFPMIGGRHAAVRLSENRKKTWREGRDPRATYTAKGRSRGRWKPKVMATKPKPDKARRWFCICMVGLICSSIIVIEPGSFFLVIAFVIYIWWVDQYVPKYDRRLKLGKDGRWR